ncbi:unnamed protein product [Hanseniaspora opuntiae]
MVQSIPIVLDNESISNILGSISLYCWIVVFLPQIYENYSRGSSEGLSIEFIIIWLIGDIFNVLGFCSAKAHLHRHPAGHLLHHC